MIRRIYRVAQREYLAYVRTKTFVIGVLSLPLMLALYIGAMKLMESLPNPPRPFTIIDETGRFTDRLVAALNERAGDGHGILRIELRDHIYRSPEDLGLPADPAARMQALQELAAKEELFAYFVISTGPEPSHRLVYYSTDPSAMRLPQLVRGILGELVTIERLQPFIADQDLLRSALQGIAMETHAITAEGEEMATAAHIARSYAPMAFVYVLWLAILVMSSHLMTSTIEEKSSRIVEVILSSTSPLEFMAGKLAGLAGAGLTTILAWVLTGVLVTQVIPNPVVQQIFTGLGSAFSGATFFWFLIYFLLGFLFYAAFYVAVGSVCNTMREAQNLLQPVMFIMIIPIFLMMYVTNNPDNIVAVVGSFFPPFTPFLMMNRIPARPPAPLWQIVTAAGLMIFSTWVMIRAAAKVFRVGILMYGKPPTLPEIVRWAKQKG
ncbi:MAG: ABC transporter permease [Candidatus Eisenbacteria bacterium]